ncbi:MAG: aconitate hydratase [Tannerellaceae bacterium]|jgi:aconitate hydratase|nr:aconitate hydratase [Tannerellaceae bacterium]
MKQDSGILEKFYSDLPKIIDCARKASGKPLTLAEKLLLAHAVGVGAGDCVVKAGEYGGFRPDRLVMQDATAQMALLQFISGGMTRVMTPSSVHCDHLIVACNGEVCDLALATDDNREVYDFLRSASDRYGLDFWEPGAGIIHQVALENYAFPGGMIVGTDSHTPNAGGLAMIAIGVGGADAVDVMNGMSWELHVPRVTGIRLTGHISGWTAPKDVILKLAGILGVAGATNSIIEYFGEGAGTISATGKATICNMGAEIGATTSIFPFDGHTSDYLRATGRGDIAAMAGAVAPCLMADSEALAHPERYYDRVIEIDLSALEPHINGPFTPDAATPISAFGRLVREKGYPRKVEVGLIGSCTNSSYSDVARVASVARQALRDGIPVLSEVIVNPGSERIRATAGRDGLTGDLEGVGAVIMASACGPCIGQWRRTDITGNRPNSIVTSFNRNFRGRNDGNSNTYSFVASPEITVALAIAGDLCFNPLCDKLKTADGREVMLDSPTGDTFPPGGFVDEGRGLTVPSGKPCEVIINEGSSRLQLLEPFPKPCASDMTGLALLIKIAGKCTTDHISPAGPWLRYRGHLANISDNMLMGATNAFGGRVNMVLNRLSGVCEGVAKVAKEYKGKGIRSLIVAGENYGEGSSREHAAMEPRYLGVRVIIAKSFARIHETNLKKQGILALTFVDKSDYDRILEGDTVDIIDAPGIAPGRDISVVLKHSDGSRDTFTVTHSYNITQIGWFMAGSALNCLKNMV